MAAMLCGGDVRACQHDERHENIRSGSMILGGEDVLKRKDEPNYTMLFKIPAHARRPSDFGAEVSQGLDEDCSLDGPN